jgi:hypothetical protein
LQALALTMDWKRTISSGRRRGDRCARFAIWMRRLRSWIYRCGGRPRGRADARRSLPKPTDFDDLIKKWQKTGLVKIPG